MEEIIKLNMRIKKTGASLEKPVTSATYKAAESKSPALLQSPSKTPTKSVRSGKEVVGSSYIQSGGKTLICPEILTIEELLDIPIPIFSKESIQKAYYGSDEAPLGRSDSVDPYGRYPWINRSSVERPDEEDTLGKRFGSRLTFDDVMKGLTKKLIAWNQFVFNHKTFEHMKERPFLYEDRTLA